MAKKNRQTQHLNFVSDYSRLDIKNVLPKTEAQRDAFEAFKEGYNLMLHGSAGTGKTFISLYLALQEVLKENSKFKHVILIRSVVPTRDMGFLPGTEKQKLQVYELPYISIVSELFRRGDAYSILKDNRIVEFISTSYIRGTTLSNSIVIVDECQNMNFHELDSVITRIGQNSRVIFSGDFKQSDLIGKEKSGLKSFLSIIHNVDSFDNVEFFEDDIVRSGLVKQYIIQKERLGIAA